MINRVVLVGRLVKDPDLRKTPNNASVVSFTVAVDNRTKDDNGKRTASFIPCVCWNAVADVVNKYAKKGSLVGVDGRINQRTYKKENGTTVQVVEVIADSVQLLGPKAENTSAAESASVEKEVSTNVMKTCIRNVSVKVDLLHKYFKLVLKNTKIWCIIAERM